MAQQMEVLAPDLERERHLNERMRLSTAVLDAVCEHKDAVLQVLEAATAGEAEAGGSRQGLGQQLSSGQHGQQRPQQASPPAGLVAQAAADPSQDLALQIRRMPFRERVALCSSMFRATRPARQVLQQQQQQQQQAALAAGTAGSCSAIVMAAGCSAGAHAEAEAAGSVSRELAPVDGFALDFG